MRWWIALVILLLTAALALLLLIWAKAGDSPVVIVNQKGSTETKKDRSAVTGSSKDSSDGTDSEAKVDPGSASTEELGVWATSLSDDTLDAQLLFEHLGYLAQASRLKRASDVRSVLKDREVDEKLIALVQSGNGDVVVDALKLVGTLGGDEVPAEVVALFAEENRDQSSYPLRAAAIRSVTGFEKVDADVISALVDRLDDPSIRVVIAAIQVLPQIEAEGHDGVRCIAPSLLNTPRSTAQEAALEVLKALPSEQSSRLDSAKTELEELANAVSSGRDAEKRIKFASQARLLLDRINGPDQ